MRTLTVYLDDAQNHEIVMGQRGTMQLHSYGEWTAQITCGKAILAEDWEQRTPKKIVADFMLLTAWDVYKMAEDALANTSRNSKTLEV